MVQIMMADKPEDSEILDLAMSRASSLVSIKLSSHLIPPLKRVGKSWKCKTFSETIDRMIDTIENGGGSSVSSLGDETRRFIVMHLNAERSLPVISRLLNKRGLVAHDGEGWTSEKLAIYCKYHGIDYQNSRP